MIYFRGPKNIIFHAVLRNRIQDQGVLPPRIRDKFFLPDPVSRILDPAPIIWEISSMEELDRGSLHPLILKYHETGLNLLHHRRVLYTKALSRQLMLFAIRNLYRSSFVGQNT